MVNTLKFRNSVFKVLLELFVWDKKFRSKLKARWAKLHLKKYVINAIKTTSIPKNVPVGNKKIIWQYWHQGEAKAPVLVKKCLESVRKNCKEFEIKVLSFDTIKDYVEIPQRYYDLLEQKKMSIAHFSDVLRLYLLSQYGGIWIDSTIYLTGKLPDEILNSEFFVPQKNPKTDAFEDKMSCFFIKANADILWVHLIKNVIESYWNENDYLVHYFIFEHAVTMLSEYSSELKTFWGEMPYYDANDMGILQKKFFENYDEEEYMEIVKKYSIHKLTYKKDNRITNGNTYYDKLIS